MNEQNKLAAMPVQRLLYTMSGPLALSLLVQSLYNIVDSIFVARLSEDALTATSLAYAVQVLMIALSVGTAVGLNALLSQRIGAGLVEEACRAATTGLWLTLISALVFAVGGIFSSTIAGWMTDDAVLRTLCAEYLTIVMLGSWGIFLQTYAQRLLQAVGELVRIASAGHSRICPCDRHRSNAWRARSDHFQPPLQSTDPCAAAWLSFCLAGCDGDLPRWPANDHDPGTWQRHDLCRQCASHRCFTNGSGILRCLLQIAELSYDAAERTRPGGDPDRRLQFWQRQLCTHSRDLACARAFRCRVGTSWDSAVSATAGPTAAVVLRGR